MFLLIGGVWVLASVATHALSNAMNDFAHPLIFHREVQQQRFVCVRSIAGSISILEFAFQNFGEVQFVYSGHYVFAGVELHSSGHRDELCVSLRDGRLLL